MNGTAASSCTSSRRLAIWMLGAALITFAVAILGIDARATYNAQTTADEPQYLMSALSLATDGDLNIANQIANNDFRPFHEVALNEQTLPPDANGNRISPHDPLLPFLIAVPMGIGGWILVKVWLAIIAAVTATVTVWVAVRRVGVALPTAAVTTIAMSVGLPMVGYATQVYPELAAALVTLIAIAMLLNDRSTTVGTVILFLCITALPWLSVKYAPVAGVLTLGYLIDWSRTRCRGPGGRVELVTFVAVGGVMMMIYLWVHQRVYGGWTVYAAGDHFVETGEFSVVGNDPDYVGRTRRVVGLLADRRYGLAAWNPVWLLAPAAITGWCFDRGRRLIVVGTIAAGWATASYIALSMHAWWVPGRQVVVVTPLVTLCLAALLDRFRWLRWPTIAAGVIGATNWIWLIWEAKSGRRTLVVDFFETDAWPYRAIAPLMAQGWVHAEYADVVRTVWVGVLAVSALAAAVAIGRRTKAVAVVVAVFVVLGVAGLFGGDDGELVRPTETNRPER